MRNPAVAVVAMAVGIGAAVAIGSVVDAVLLRPLPYPEPGRLVVLWNRFTGLGIPELSLSEPEVVDYRTRCTSLQALAAVAIQAANVTGSGEPERLRIAAASPSLFTILGARPRLGRVFADGEDRPGAGHVALLSDAFWRRRQGGDPQVIGRDLLMNGDHYKIIGVMPAGFHYPEKVDLWVPLVPSADLLTTGSRSNHYLRGLARLKPGVRLREAQAEVEAVALQLQKETPVKYPANSGWGATLVPFQEDLTGDVRPALLKILAVVGLVLLMACANAASLQRERALDVRRSIAESLWITVLGGGVGTLIAALGVRALTRMDPATLPRAREIAVDGRVLLFAVALALVSGLAIGLVAGRPSSRRGRRLLTAVEMALALVLAIVAGRQARTYLELRRVDLGFDTDNALSLQLSLSSKTYAAAPQVSAFYQRLADGAAALPRVRHAAVVDCLPLSRCGVTASVYPEDRASDDSFAAPESDLRIVTWDYFAAIGMRPPLQGRLLGAQDSADAPRAVVLDEGLARRTWPGQNPLGKHLKFTRKTTNPQRSVVGVVRHVKDTSLDADPRDQIYVPFVQFPFAFNEAFLVVRCEGDPATLAAPLRSLVRKLDVEVPVFDVQTLSQRRDGDLASQRLSLFLLVSLALLALFQAAIGAYGVIAHAARQRSSTSSSPT